jgi:hypothetical protein
VEHLNSSRTSPRASPKAEWLLLFFFIIFLPLLNPWVRGDGVGYYAFARAPIIQHNLDFERDYQSANASFRELRLDENGQPRSFFRTSTGHLDNHFTVGPAILWSPFLLLAHAGVLLARAMGSTVAADGFSAPYRIAMAFGTAFYAFLGLLLSFRIACHYVQERWALLATIAVWWGSSLPVYMYFNPSWSHAHSAFVVALFLWYWHTTRGVRTLTQWLVLGACAGLMMNVYYPNSMILTVLLVEAIPKYLAAFRKPADSNSSTQSSAFNDGNGSNETVFALAKKHFLFFAMVFVCLLPTFLTRLVVYGGLFESGYIPLKYWLWRSPVFFSVLFSANHGLLSWTPLLALSIVGLFIFWRRVPGVGLAFLATFGMFYLFICCYPDWAGISSFGNRFFVSLTALFIIGLSVFLDSAAKFFRNPKLALAASSVVLAAFLLWNVEFIFQWGEHLIPPRGPISFSEMVRNQFFVVPRQITNHLQTYLFRRHAMMDQIEKRDIEQLKTPIPQ